MPAGQNQEIWVNGRHHGYFYTAPTGSSAVPYLVNSATDWVGTERMHADRSGNQIVTFCSLPFGDQVQNCVISPTNTGPSDLTFFTGKERDSVPDDRNGVSGIDYFGARYYSSTMGRFMSADWSDDPDPIPYGDPENPQSLNLYSYVANNPISSSDDDGHQVAPDANCGWLCQLWHWLNKPSPAGQATEGASIEIGNTFQSAGNFINRQLGGPQTPLASITGTWQQAGATAAGIGMLFIPGGGEAEGLQVLSREQLLAEATNPAVRNAIDMMFREGATIGDGSTAAAIEHELATGERVGGRSHLIKGPELLRFLKKIKAGEKGSLSPREEVIIQAMIDRLRVAVEKIGAQ